MPDRKDGRPQQQRGGRPVGAATCLTRKRANEICSSGRSPLDLMSENMLFWDDRAAALGEKLSELLSGEQRLFEAENLFNEILIARDNAQRCAVDAAPYVHPKLQAIATQNLQFKRAIEVKTIIPNDTRGEDRSYRKKSEFSKREETE